MCIEKEMHCNPCDPDVGISIKPVKARKLNYRCSMFVDAVNGVISLIQADFADGRDSQYLPRIVSVLLDRLRRNHLRLTDLIADRIIIEAKREGELYLINETVKKIAY